MLNTITLQGRVCTDITLRKTQSDKSVASFCIAVDRDYQTGGKEKQTDFINITAWGGTADFVSKWFSKGSKMLVQGKLQSRKWETDKGEKRINWEVVADTVYFDGDKKNDIAPQFEDVDDDGELPF